MRELRFEEGRFGQGNGIERSTNLQNRRIIKNGFSSKPRFNLTEYKYNSDYPGLVQTSKISWAYKWAQSFWDYEPTAEKGPINFIERVGQKITKEEITKHNNLKPKYPNFCSKIKTEKIHNWLLPHLACWERVRRRNKKEVISIRELCWRRRNERVNKYKSINKRVLIITGQLHFQKLLRLLDLKSNLFGWLI